MVSALSHVTPCMQNNACEIQHYLKVAKTLYMLLVVL